MFKNHYPDFRELKFKPLHITEYLADQELPLKEYPKTLTYHDPCHLGRHAKVYDAPREIIKKIPKATFKEMDLIRDQAVCCGGGGGLRAGFGDMSKRIAGRRVESADFADVLLTPCPFCVNNLLVGKEAKNCAVEIKDIVELIDELLEEKNAD
jgi:Fe-S oxidoreductase